MKKNNILKIYIIAGEGSGDVIGANLIKSLRENYDHDYDINFRCIGGSLIKDLGCKMFSDYADLAVIGFTEVLPLIFRIMKKIRQTVDDIILYNPDVLITIDSPGFNFRLVKQLRKKKFNKPIVHYVAPTVWAYNPKRAEIVKQLYDHIFLLFPFEIKYFQQMPHTFVGHPLMEKDEIDKRVENESTVLLDLHVIEEVNNNTECDIHTTESDFAVDDVTNKNIQNESQKINKNSQKIAIMPGSRVGEIKKHIPILLQTIENIENYGDSLKNINWYFLCHNKTTNLIKQMIENIQNIRSIDGYYVYNSQKIFVVTNNEQKNLILATSDLGLIKCGTSILEAALSNLPMIAFYKINALSAWFLRRKILISYITLCNIILNKPLIPELLQENFNAKLLSFWIEQMIKNKILSIKQKEGFSEIFYGMQKNTAITSDFLSNNCESISKNNNYRDLVNNNNTARCYKPSQIAAFKIIEIANKYKKLN